MLSFAWSQLPAAALSSAIVGSSKLFRPESDVAIPASPTALYGLFVVRSPLQRCQALPITQTGHPTSKGKHSHGQVKESTRHPHPAQGIRPHGHAHAQKAREATLYRSPDEPEDDWAQMMQDIGENDGVTVETLEDGGSYVHRVAPKED